MWVVLAAIQIVCSECLELSTVPRDSLDGGVLIVFPAIRAVLSDFIPVSLSEGRLLWELTAVQGSRQEGGVFKIQG